MEMIQTYQGYFQEDGRFITDSLLVQMPTRRRAIVNILDDEVVEVNSDKIMQQNAFKEFFATMKSLDEKGIEPLDEEFDAIIESGVSIGGELDL